MTPELSTRRREQPRVNALLVVVLLVVVALLMGRNAGWFGQMRPVAERRVVQPRGDLAADERSTIELFRSASPSVVNVRTRARRLDPFSMNVPLEQQGSGSGVVWDSQGHVVTNYHVLEGADSADVMLADRSIWQARLVGYTVGKDLAVLKIEAPHEKLPPIAVGNVRESAGGPESVCDWQSVRTGSNADNRNHQRSGTGNSELVRSSDQGGSFRPTRQSTRGIPVAHCSTVLAD